MKQEVGEWHRAEIGLRMPADRQFWPGCVRPWLPSLALAERERKKKECEEARGKCTGQGDSFLQSQTEAGEKLRQEDCREFNTSLTTEWDHNSRNSFSLKRRMSQ